MSTQKKQYTFVFLISMFCVLTGGIYLSGQTTEPTLSLAGALLRASIVSIFAAPFLYLYVRSKRP